MDVTAQLISQVDNMYIEVEIPQREIEQFKRRYVNLGGSLKRDGLLIQKNRGCNCRIYFNASDFIVEQLGMFGYIAVEGGPETKRGPRYANQFRWRLDSNELFWKLVRNGFHIGGWPVAVSPNEEKAAA